MDERAWLTDRFEEHRTRLRAVAYRMLGSLSEADDAVQLQRGRATVRLVGVAPGHADDPMGERTR